MDKIEEVKKILEKMEDTDYWHLTDVAKEICQLFEPQVKLSQWRPKDWRNPYEDNEFWPECGRCFARFEAGADAMLEALKRKGKHALWETSKLSAEYGTWVFIPDEELKSGTVPPEEKDAD